MNSLRSHRQQIPFVWTSQLLSLPTSR